VGIDRDGHFESRITETKLSALGTDNDPASPQALDVGELQIHNNPTRWQLANGEVTMNEPHQDARIELVAGELASHPALAPMTEKSHQGTQILCGARRSVFVSVSPRCCNAREKTLLLQHL